MSNYLKTINITAALVIVTEISDINEVAPAPVAPAVMAALKILSENDILIFPSQ